MPSFSHLRVAIVTDWLTTLGGAEKVLESLMKLFPQAHVHSSVFLPEVFPFLQNTPVFTTWLNRLPKFLKSRHPLLFPFLPRAIETLDLSEYDLVISSSSFIAKGVITKPDTLHICYCHTPTRYLWDDWKKYIMEEMNIPASLRFLRHLVPFFLRSFRQWDFLASKRPDIMIANSPFIAERIKKYYHRDAEVISPPVDYERFAGFIVETGLKPVSGSSMETGLKPVCTKPVSTITKKSFFIACGRLIPYKKFDLLVETFRDLPHLSLKIVGKGVERGKLERMAEGAKNIEFLGFVEDLPALLASARALLFPQVEDAGIVPLEALSAGTPVIAYRKGGVIGVVEEGVNGLFFEEQTKESLIESIQKFLEKESSFSRETIQKTAFSFREEAFLEKIAEVVERQLSMVNWRKGIWEKE